MKSWVGLLFLSATAWGGMSSDLRVSGTVESFDSRSVTLQHHNTFFQIPRRLLKRDQELRPGKRIEVMVTAQEFTDLVQPLRRGRPTKSTPSGEH